MVAVIYIRETSTHLFKILSKTSWNYHMEYNTQNNASKVLNLNLVSFTAIENRFFSYHSHSMFNIFLIRMNFSESLINDFERRKHQKISLFIKKKNSCNCNIYVEFKGKLYKKLICLVFVLSFYSVPFKISIISLSNFVIYSSWVVDGKNLRKQSYARHTNTHIPIPKTAWISLWIFYKEK